MIILSPSSEAKEEGLWEEGKLPLLISLYGPYLGLSGLAQFLTALSEGKTHHTEGSWELFKASFLGIRTDSELSLLRSDF